MILGRSFSSPRTIFRSIAILLVSLSGAGSQANEIISVNVEGTGEGPNSIQWNPMATATFVRIAKTGSAAKAQIQGSLPDSDWSILHGTKPIVVGKKEFSFPLTLTSAESTLDVVLIDPLGKAFPQHVKFSAPEWANSVEALQAFQQQRSRMSVSLGPAFVNLQQKDVPTYTQTGLSVSAGYTKPLSMRMDANVHAFFTALPLSSSRSDVTVRSFGLNARLGYNPLQLKHPWYLSLMGGIYFNTMIMNPQRFGYTNVGGPQLYPLLRYRLDERSSISGFLKFSPVNRRPLAFLSLASYEASTGISYSRPMNQILGLLFAANYSHLKLNLTDQNTSLTVKTISLSVGLTY